MVTAEPEVLTFYHFTRGGTLARIVNQNDGLKKGDVPTTPESGFNAVWLTSDPNPENFICRGFPEIEKEKKQVRITVQVPTNDPNLRKWRDVAKDYKIKVVGIQTTTGCTVAKLRSIVLSLWVFVCRMTLTVCSRHPS